MPEFVDRGSVMRTAHILRPNDKELASAMSNIPIADVVPAVCGRCPVCLGQEVLTQDCDNGYSVEVDAYAREMTVWQGDTCLAAISIDYCPNCGAKMDGGADHA